MWAICGGQGGIDLCSVDAATQTQHALGTFTKKKQVRASRVTNRSGRRSMPRRSVLHF